MRALANHPVAILRSSRSRSIRTRMGKSMHAARSAIKRRDVGLLLLPRGRSILRFVKNTEDFDLLADYTVGQQMGNLSDVQFVNAVDAFRRPSQVRVLDQRGCAMHDVADDAVGDFLARIRFVVSGY